MSCRCVHCRRRFTPRAQNKGQRFCSRRICQRQRRNLWRKRKRTSDADYQANQRDARERWLEKNPDYYRNYRKSHPDYVKKNRQKQRERNRRRSRSGRPCFLRLHHRSRRNQRMPSPGDSRLCRSLPRRTPRAVHTFRQRCCPGPEYSHRPRRHV